MSLVGFTRPSLEDLVVRLEAEVNARLPTIDVALRQSVPYALVRADAGANHSLYGLAGWIADQCNVLYCEGANLDAWGLVWNVTRKAGSAASGEVVLTGADGAVIAPETELQTSSNLRFQTVAEAAVADGTVTVPIESAADGVVYNLADGAALTLIAPVAGVNAAGVVTGGLTGGADVETDDEYRARLLSRLRLAAHGGNAKDYTDWTKEVAGVTRAWSFPLEQGPGSVVVRFMMDEAYTDGLPEAGDVATVAAHLAPYRPVTCSLYVYAPEAVPLAIEITDLVPDDAGVRAAVAAEVAEVIKRTAEPGGTIALSSLWGAIAQATGVRSFRVTAPVDDSDYAPGEIAVPGAITYVTT